MQILLRASSVVLRFSLHKTSFLTSCACLDLRRNLPAPRPRIHNKSLREMALKTPFLVLIIPRITLTFTNKFRKCPITISKTVKGKAPNQEKTKKAEKLGTQMCGKQVSNVSTHCKARQNKHKGQNQGKSKQQHKWSKTSKRAATVQKCSYCTEKSQKYICEMAKLAKTKLQA